MLIRSQFVHRKKKTVIETDHENVLNYHVKCLESKYAETFISKNSKYETSRKIASGNYVDSRESMDGRT